MYPTPSVPTHGIYPSISPNMASRPDYPGCPPVINHTSTFAHSIGTCVPASAAIHTGIYPRQPPNMLERPSYSPPSYHPSAPAINSSRVESTYVPWGSSQVHRSGFGWIPPSHCIGTHQWIPCYNGQVPPEAVHAGQDKDGGYIYVGRAFHDGELIPAKVCPTHGAAFVSYNGMEVTKTEYEVLCSNHVAWKFSQHGEYPPEAIRAGNTREGEPLFVGRTMIDGTMTPGKVHPSHRCLFVPYGGGEHRFHEYEILILN